METEMREVHTLLLSLCFAKCLASGILKRGEN